LNDLEQRNDGRGALSLTWCCSSLVVGYWAVYERTCMHNAAYDIYESMVVTCSTASCTSGPQSSPAGLLRRCAVKTKKIGQSHIS